MVRFILSNKAIEDLSEIWNYTYDFWSESQADKYYQLIIDTCKEIGEKPDVGKNYDGILYSLLGLKTGRHIIFYRKAKENKVEIIRILHEQMDLKNRIKE